MQVAELEQQLRQLLEDTPGLKQQSHDDWADQMTWFIYSAETYCDLQSLIAQYLPPPIPERNRLVDTAKYRWFNFKVSKACEMALCRHPGITPHPNTKHKLIDVFVDSVQFDLKATVLPKGWDRGIVLSNPRRLLNYYYSNQSSGSRQGLNNRLFIALADDWKEKANVGRMIAAADEFAINRGRYLHISSGEGYKGLVAGLILA